MKYNYTIDIYILHACYPRPYRTLSGTVEAERYSTACQQAWQRINAECEEMRQETGQQTAAGHFIVNPES